MASRINSLVLFFIFSCLYFPSVYADLLLSAPPRETADMGDKMYGPIAEDLSKVTGKKVVYVHPRNWTEYARNMREDKYDIVFDGAHFAAWRMKHLQHTPVAKLGGTLGFVIVAKSTEKESNNLKDLIGKSLCGIASPNLGTMVAFSIFDNPVIQPEIKVIKGNVADVYKAFVNGECNYAVLLDRYYNNLPADAKKTIKIIARSAQMPNQTFTVSRRITAQDIDKIEKFMTTPAAALAGQKLLNLYSKKNPFFFQTTTKEYQGLESLLEGVVFGW